MPANRELRIAMPTGVISDHARESLMPPIDSSFIAAIDYDDGSARLSVRLRDGKRYVFFLVPRQVYEDFLVAESKGTFLNTVVKPRYRAQALM